MPPPATTAPPSADRDSLLAALASADLLTPAQMRRAAEVIAAASPTAPDAAGALVAVGLLTRFQADRLLSGRTEGFHLGPYVVLEQVGRGPTGRVYRAKHRTMNRPVAVKVLAGDLTRTADARSAFQAEVRAAARLNHPNIVSAYDVNEYAGRFYVVVEFVDGPGLDAVVRERGQLPTTEACELVRQAALGLAHAHEQGMSHRDLKPTNLLVARPSRAVPEPQVKIADFGTARLAPPPDRTPAPGGGAAECADYLAPEQAHAPAHADHGADVYSLGCVLYFLLAGRPPFPGGTAEEKVRRHLWEEPTRIDLLRPDVPPFLVMLVHRMMAKHPIHRPAASEVAEQLAALASFGAVCFDLPAYSGPLSGPLSGGYPRPTGEPTPQATPAPRSAASGTSPWEQIAGADETPLGEEGATLEFRLRRTRGARRGLSGTATAIMAGGLVALCLGVVGVLVKTMAK